MTFLHFDGPDNFFKKIDKQMFLFSTDDSNSPSSDNTGKEGIVQVFLYNDDKNSFEHVVKSLMDVFGHNLTIASRLAVEAHSKGKALAEIEGKGSALHHKDQLVSSGLIAEVTKL